MITRWHSSWCSTPRSCSSLRVRGLPPQQQKTRHEAWGIVGAMGKDKEDRHTGLPWAQHKLLLSFPSNVVQKVWLFVSPTREKIETRDRNICRAFGIRQLQSVRLRTALSWCLAFRILLFSVELTLLWMRITLARSWRSPFQHPMLDNGRLLTPFSPNPRCDSTMLWAVSTRLWFGRTIQKSGLQRSGRRRIEGFCGRKNKYGLNLQAICNHKERFTSIDIRYGASSSDHTAFEVLDLQQVIFEEWFLALGLVLFGDNT